MISQFIQFTIYSAHLLQAEEAEKFPWWLVLLILAIVIVVVIWALTRNAAYTETPHIAHSHEADEPIHAPVPIEHTPVEPPVEVAPLPEPEAPQVEVVRAAEPIPAPVEVSVPIVPDDLKLIEGIGPKIASLLHAFGIVTFAQLAETPVAALQEMLDKANLRLGDPATWPEQARLAAKGDMEGLQALQDSLKGGRKE